MTTYTIFGQATNWPLQSGDTGSYTLGMQFAVSQNVSLTGIWFHSATGAGGLPAECAIYNADTGTLLSGTDNASPSWSGAAGSGWIKCTYGGTVTLTPGTNYAVAVLGKPGTTWYSEDNQYWISGPGSSGLTNGPLSAPNSAGALHGQAVYHAGSTLTFPTTTTTGYDFGVDVEVSSIAGSVAPAATTPLIIPPHPLFPRVALEEAYQRADWQAQGVADLTVAFASTSGGVDTYNVSSPWNGTATYQMRVLAPTAPNPDYQHAFLLMLPVQQNQDTGSYGDPIGTAQTLAAHNGYNLTCVQPGYAPLPTGAEGPWFADNPLVQAISQEKFTLLVTAWIRKHLATTGQEQVYLIGFSRSGLGGMNLLFRHPYTYAAVAAWDSPFGMSDYDGTDPVRGSGVGGSPTDGFGTSANFTNNYELTTARLAGYQGTGQYGINRIWLGLGPSFQPDVPWFDGQLTANQIPHTYTFGNIVEAHAWQTDWVAAGLQAIIPSNDPTVLPQQLPPHRFYDLLEAFSGRLNNNAAPPVTLSGTAAITGQGSLGDAGTLGSGGTMGGQGSLGSPAVTQAAPATLAGGGSLTGLDITQAAPATLAGQGTVTTAAAAAAPATLAGQGSLADAATEGAGGTLGGQGALAAPASTLQAPATLAGQGTVTATATLGGVSALAGQGDLGQPDSAIVVPAALAGQGTLAASTSPQGAAGLAGQGALAAPATIAAPATLTGQGALADTAAQAAAGLLAGQGTVGPPALTVAAVALLQGAGQLTATGAAGGGVGATLAGGGSLSAPAVTVLAAAMLAGQGRLAAATLAAVVYGTARAGAGTAPSARAGDIRADPPAGYGTAQAGTWP